MAIDSKQKRMSAINISAPWRGAMVDATEVGFTQGNRQAAAYMYSGILAGGAVAIIADITKQFLGEIQQFGFGSIFDSSMGVT